jgi:hypothetical protein
MRRGSGSSHVEAAHAPPRRVPLHRALANVPDVDQGANGHPASPHRIRTPIGHARAGAGECAQASSAAARVRRR